MPDGFWSGSEGWSGGSYILGTGVQGESVAWGPVVKGVLPGRAAKDSDCQDTKAGVPIGCAHFGTRC